MRIKNENERKFYEIEATNEAWGIRTLQRQYNSSLYEILALSREKDEVMWLASEGNVIARPQNIVKQPTVLEFLGLDEKVKYVESDLETAIINKLQKFLLEWAKAIYLKQDKSDLHLRKTTIMWILCSITDFCGAMY